MNTTVLPDRTEGSAPLAAVDPNTPIPKARWAEFGLPPSDSHQRRLVRWLIIEPPQRFSPRKQYYRLGTLLEYRDRPPELREAAWWRGRVVEALYDLDHPLSRPEHIGAARETLSKLNLSETAARHAARWSLEQVLASDAYRKTKAKV